MEINREFAMKLWEAIYGNDTLVKDCFGTYIYKYDFDDTNTIRRSPSDGKEYKYGWDIDHILPLKLGGSNDLNNLEPMHFLNNRKKSGKTSFTIDNTEYEVYRCRISMDGYKGYGIIKVKDATRVDWKFVYNKHF